MRLLQPLKEKPVALLWGGQVLSSIGDELHKVAFVWLTAGILGASTGYVTAVQAGSVFVLSLFGGLIAERWNHRKTLIVVDIVRGVVVLALPLWTYFSKPNIYILLFVGVTVAGLNALFTPALRALIPSVVSERRLLQPTNGLMETTTRIARIIGPGLVGILNGVIPFIHFFTIDAISFFISAKSVALIEGSKDEPVEKLSSKDKLLGGWRALQKSPLLRYLILTDGVLNPAWYLVFPLAVGLLLHEKMPENVGALGYTVAGYGVGNVLSNVILGSVHLKRPTLFCWYGRVACGFGFILLAYAHTLPLMMIASGIAATGGPMTDLSFTALLQKDYGTKDIARIFRLDLAITYGALCALYAVSPLLFENFGYGVVIAASGAVMIVVGLLGFALFGGGQVLEK